MKLNFEGLEMQKWNIPKDTAQRINEKNGVSSVYFSYLLPELSSFKMSKMALFCISSSDRKKSVTVWAK